MLQFTHPCKHWFVLLFVFATYFTALSAQCPSSYFTTQAQVNLFPSQYPLCTQISSLTVKGSNITSLAPFAQLTFAGYVEVTGTNITDFTGLDSITSMRILKIESNPYITNLIGFNNLRTLEDLAIKTNSALTNFEGLGHLDSIHYGFAVTGNPNLVNFAGMSALRDISSKGKNTSSTGFKEGFSVTNNPKLQNLSGLSQLRYINSIMTLSNNRSLVNMDGLLALDSIKGELTLSNDSSLINLYGFGKVRLTGGLSLSGNPKLENLIGLEQIVGFSGGISLQDNIALTTLNGLDNFYGLSQGISIVRCPKLTELVALGKIKSLYSLNLDGLDALKNLNGLSQLTDVWFSISIKKCNGLTDLGTISSLKRVIGVEITQNQNLISLGNWPVLERISGTFAITQNPKLEQVGSFPNLVIAQDMTITENAALKHTGHFLQLKTVNNQIKIRKNGALETIQDFPALEEIATLDISENQLLRHLAGFSNLKKLSNQSTLYVFANPSLETITGFARFQGSIFINGNQQLQSIDMSSLSDTMSGLYISRNRSLERILGFDHVKMLHTIWISQDTSLRSIAAFGSLISSTSIRLTDNPVLDTFQFLKGLVQVDELKIQNNRLNGTEIDLTALVYALSITIESNSGLKEIKGRIQQDGPVNQFGTTFIAKFNPKLEQITGFNTLKYLQQFDVTDNAVLKQINGFSKIGSVNNLQVANLPLLEQMTIFQDSSYFPNYYSYKLIFSNLPKLAHLPSLRCVKKTVELTIDQCGAITTLIGLDSLRQCSTLTIQQCNALPNLAGLNQLDSIKSSIIITSNAQLTSLFGIPETAFLSTASIYQNPKLSYCAVIPICNRIALPNALFISANTGGCADKNAVQFQCTNTLSSISGKTYYDMNCDSVYTASVDVVSPYTLLKNTATGLPYAFATQQGDYQFFMLNNSQLTLEPVVPVVYVVPTAASRSYQIGSTVQQFINQDYGFCTDAQIHDVQIATTAFSPPRPGFQFSMQVCVKNLTPVTETNVQVSLDIPTNLQGLLTLTNAAGGVTNTNGYSWQLGTLPPFADTCVTIVFQLTPTTPLGTLLVLGFRVQYDQDTLDVTRTENTIRWIQNVVGSYDPNNKTTEITTIPFHGGQPRSVIEYTVRFQNTGTFPATFVEVYDTISNQLDLSTFEMVATSHQPYTLTFPTDGVLKWRFDNINLPDSLTDPIGSQGYITFRLAAKDSLPLYHQIKNAVSIYFDFNTPVLTDSSVTTVCPDLGLQYLSYPARCGKQNGVAIVHVGTGVPTSLIWSNGQTGSKITGLIAGHYSVTITPDSSICSQVLHYFVEEIPTIVVDTVQLQHVQCHGGTTGHITSQVLQGTPPFRYRWNTNDSIPHLSQLAAGLYSLTVTDQLNCKDTLIAQIIQPSTALDGSIIMSPDHGLPNAPDGTLQCIPIGGTAPYLFAWSTSDNTGFVSNLTPGTYTCTITDAQMCTFMQSAEVTLSVSTTTIAEQEIIWEVHPNPCSAFAQISCKSGLNKATQYVVSIRNVVGKTIHTEQWQPHAHPLTFNMNHWPQGVYFIDLQEVTSGLNQSLQLIKQE
jgi:uncharacterized repeat protein (TIGR01451 family)